MGFLTSLLPKIELLGNWVYWIILLVTILESTAFIGLIIPGTIVLVFMGFLVAQGILDIYILFWFISVGGIIGDTISFYAGKKGLDTFKVTAKFKTSKYLLKGEEFFNRWVGHHSQYISTECVCFSD